MAPECEADNHEYRNCRVGSHMHNGRAEVVVAVRRVMWMVVFIRVSMVVVMTAVVIMAVQMLMAAAEEERTYDIDDQAQSRDRDCLIEAD
jgi:hypothetical protein